MEFTKLAVLYIYGFNDNFKEYNNYVNSIQASGEIYEIEYKDLYLILISDKDESYKMKQIKKIIGKDINIDEALNKCLKSIRDDYILYVNHGNAITRKINREITDLINFKSITVESCDYIKKEDEENIKLETEKIKEKYKVLLDKYKEIGEYILKDISNEHRIIINKMINDEKYKKEYSDEKVRILLNHIEMKTFIYNVHHD